MQSFPRFQILTAGAIAALLAVPALAAPPPAQSRPQSAVQSRTDRDDPDQWARTAEKADAAKKAGTGIAAHPSEPAADAEEDADTSSEDKNDEEEKTPPKAPQHRGELNGKLDLGDW